MENHLTPDDGRCFNIWGPAKKVNFTKNPMEPLPDIVDGQRWKYDELCPGAHDSVIENTAGKSPIQRILIPVDPVQVKVTDLRSILQIAQRFDAEVTLFHCYEMPPSFCYAAGRSGLRDLILHPRRVRMHLLKLCAEVRRLFPKCCSEFASGSLPIEILRASRQIQSDLIVVLLSPEFVSHSWTAKELMNELVRKANCAVLGISSSRSEEPIAIESVR